MAGAKSDAMHIGQYFKMKGGKFTAANVMGDGIDVEATKDATDEHNGQAFIEGGSITLNVADLLDDLIRQADALVGKPPALMTKDDKVRAIRYLSHSGALMITKSGDKIAKHFGISKYTLYSYLDNGKTGGETTHG